MLQNVKNHVNILKTLGIYKISCKDCEQVYIGQNPLQRACGLQIKAVSKELLNLQFKFRALPIGKRHRPNQSEDVKRI